MTTLKINNTLRGNDVYTKETAESLPLYLGSLRLIDNFWNLISIDEYNNIVVVEYFESRTETLKTLNDDLKTMNIQEVRKLSKQNKKNASKIFSFYF